MNKPNGESVTDVPCTCGTVFKYAIDSMFPVEYDARENRYYIVHNLPDGMLIRMMIHHCFFCGGVIPGYAPPKDTVGFNLRDQE